MIGKLRHLPFLLVGLLTWAWGTASPAATPQDSAPPQAAAKSIPDRLRALREHAASAGIDAQGLESHRSRFAQWFNFRNKK
jgi:hypothetical protein